MRVERDITSAGWAAALFWTVYLAIALAFLFSYWNGSPRLALTAALALPIWAATGALWAWRLSEEDDRIVEQAREASVSRYDDPTGKQAQRAAAKSRLRRRRLVAIPILSAAVITAFVLWAIAIWTPHGHAYSITAVILLGTMVPIVLATTTD